ncbi:restriction endonuclease subunit S [Bacteroides acidifaciens]|uniref:restriction endonuclease subunit S n=1 Tax=Bacteroides acidifaciens TaxID=85831 RepID=UPI000468DC29|nr:restriction endonuclease subunit S [Bacteroides acidifaciens]MCR1998381.1 restriction endonuclease subunit S [Bacteroides acidifaciens]
MEQWRQDRLIDILDTLIDYRGKTPNKVDCGIPLITAKIVKNGRIDTPTEFLPTEDYNGWMVRGFPQVGDVVLTTEAPLGEVAQLTDEKIALAQRIVCLRGKEGVLDNTYLKYFFLSNIGQNRLKARETGTTVTGIKQSELKEILIDYPKIDTQKAIASVLSSLDSKIELNRRINDNLEQQAQALFKAWFVDFEPFKDGKFVESELGMIPEGCRVGKAEDFYNINIGKTPPRKEQIWFSSNSSDYTWVSISDLGSCGRFVFTSSEFLTHEAIKRHNIILVPKDTILLSFKLTIGRVGIAGTELTTNEAIARFITSDENREYTYFLLKGYNYEKLGSTSSIATAVNSKIIKAMVVLMPDKEILKAFSSLTKPYFDQILRNEQESIRLTILRDTLLPKLMSGELKINATEVL